MSWRNELLAVWAVTLRNALMGARNVFFFFELLFWPIVGVLSIGLMSRFLELTSAQASEDGYVFPAHVAQEGQLQHGFTVRA